MSSARVFIGRVPFRASERDVEDFFRGYGRVRDIVLKNGFGFVSFDDARDADDAVYDTNGKSLCGERVVVEHVRSRGRGFGGGGDCGDRDGGGGGGFRGGGWGGDRRGGDRYGRPTQTRHRLLVENLSSRVSWQDLKDLIRSCGVDVSFADAHKQRKNEGIVCFGNRPDLLKAMEKYQGHECEGRQLKLIDDSSTSRSRSRSRTPRHRRRSRSRGTRSKSRSKSRSRTRSRSSSAGKDEKKKKRAKKVDSKKKNGGKSSAARSKSRSKSPSKERSKELSRSPAEKNGDTKERLCEPSAEEMKGDVN